MSLKELRYVRVKPEGLFVSVDGLPKCGKTSLGLSMPEPLFILDMNLGLEGLIERHVENDKEIYVQTIQLPLSKELPGQPWALLATAAADQWRKAILTLQEALKEPSITSIFIDTGSELWDLLRIARLGKLSQVLPIQYTQVNAEFRQLLQLLLTSKKKVLMAHKVKAEYVNDQKTNRFERAGFGDVGFDVQLEIRADRDPKAVGDDQFTLTFGDCRMNKNLKGQVIRGAECSWTTVEKMVYGEPDAG